MAQALRVDVRTNFRETLARIALAEGEIANAAAVRALNRTGAAVRTEAVRQIRGRYNLRAGTVRDQIRIVRASRQRLTVDVIASGAPIPLVEFGARQTKKGVTVRVTKQRKLVKGVFIARMKSGKVGVFERLGKARLPIRELFSISLPRTFTQRQILAALQKVAAERFNLEFQRDLAYRLGRL